MSDISLGTRAVITRVVMLAAVMLLAGCQSPAPVPDTSAHQKAEAAKLNAELSQEIEKKRAREKAAQ